MTFFERALLVGVLIGLLCGLVGCLVVLRKRVFFTQALTHATFPGAVLAAVAGVNVLVGAGVFGLVLVGVMLLLQRLPRQGTQTAAGVVLTGGFALGMTIQALNPQLQIQPESLLVGTIFYVGDDAAPKAAIALVAAVLVLLLFGRRILFSSFDPEGFRAAGYREWFVELLVLALIVATVITALPAAGAVLSIALIAAPAAAARLLTKSVLGMLVLSPLIGAGSAVLGIHLSLWFGVSAGAAIALTTVLVFLIALGADALRGVPWRARGIGRGAPDPRSRDEAQHLAA